MTIKSPENLFNSKAGTYAKYRPAYPSEVIDQILSHYSDHKKITAIDVGAGTGIASRMLAEQGINVVAAEPNKSMIQEATPHPNVKYRLLGAEDLQANTSSVDLVSSFQSFHWFSFKQSLQEFKRVLKPSGQLVIVWNYWDTNDSFTAKYAQLIDQAANKNPDRTSPYDGFPSGLIKKLRIKLLWKLRYLPYFKNIKRFQYTFEQEVNMEVLRGSAYSQSYIKHEGPAWNELVTKIEHLYHQHPNPRLMYAINLFTGQPRK